MRTGVCEYCQTPLVIMDTRMGVVLPVERQEGQIYSDDDVFNHHLHKSHLLNCIPMSMNWNRKRKKFMDENIALAQLDQSVRSSTKDL